MSERNTHNEVLYKLFCTLYPTREQESKGVLTEGALAYLTRDQRIHTDILAIEELDHHPGRQR